MVLGCSLEWQRGRLMMISPDGNSYLPSADCHPLTWWRDHWLLTITCFFADLEKNYPQLASSVKLGGDIRLLVSWSGLRSVSEITSTPPFVPRVVRQSVSQSHLLIWSDWPACQPASLCEKWWQEASPAVSQTGAEPVRKYNSLFCLPLWLPWLALIWSGSESKYLHPALSFKSNNKHLILAMVEDSGLRSY